MRLEHGVRVSDYNLLHFLAALPVGLLLQLWILFVRHTSKITFPENFRNLPSNTLLFTIHKDLYTSITIFPGVLTPFTNGLVWLGYHGFLSYIPYFWFMSGRIQVFRYQKHSDRKPLQQIIDYMKERPQFGYCQYTDSGGPYGRVRESLGILAKEIHRPVVAIRIHAKPHLPILAHQFPLPFSKLEVRISEPVPANYFTTHSVEECRDRLQKELDLLS